MYRLDKNIANKNKENISNLKQINKFQKVEIPEKIKSMAATNDRIILITQNGNVYSKGDNSNGSLGLGYEYQSYVNQFKQIPSHFFDSNVTHVACGPRHTLFQTEKGRLYACGNDNKLQLGLFGEKNQNKT